VRVGKNAQFCCSGAFPATFFSRSSAYSPLLEDEVDDDNDLVVSVSNVSDEPQLARCQLESLAPTSGLRMQPMGLGYTRVRPRGTCIVHVQSQYPIIATSLVVSSTVGHSFSVSQVGLDGRAVWTPPGGSCPGRELSERKSPCLWPSGLKIRECREFVDVHVENQTEVDQYLSGVLVGYLWSEEVARRYT
jgi:hypothetical protein